MLAPPFKTDEKITVESKSVTRDPEYNSEIVTWTTVASRIWANVQDVLPSRSESVKQGIRVGIQQTRIRVRNNSAITAEMRVTLHGRGGRVMQIISGPARLDDGAHMEFVAESYSS
jgi:SPP1 family predicted phage head-tail adaptor